MSIDVWERAAHPRDDHQGVPAHRRNGSLAASPPGSRVIELTQMLERNRQYLADACVEVRRLQTGERRYTTIGGVSFAGIAAAQVWADFTLWEAILNENPELRGIVEIGTWQGGFSLWLLAQARAREKSFMTLDAVVPDSADVRRQLSGYFWKADAFAEADRIGEQIRSWEPVIVFCDGGNKPRELKTFPSYFLDPRSIVVVHDWGTETQPEDVPAFLEPIYEDFCVEIGSISRVFRAKC